MSLEITHSPFTAFSLCFFCEIELNVTSKHIGRKTNANLFTLIERVKISIVTIGHPALVKPKPVVSVLFYFLIGKIWEFHSSNSLLNLAL